MQVSLLAISKKNSPTMRKCYKTIEIDLSG